MKTDQREPIFPPNDAPHLTDWLFEIGPTAQESPISWQEMAAWSHNSGVELDPWEGRTLRRLSKAYLNERYDAKKPNCPEPRLKADEIATRNRVDDQFAALIGAVQAGAGQT